MKTEGVPCVLAVSKRDVLQRRFHKLVLHAFARLLPHVGEPKRVEHLCVWVQCFVVVCWMSCSSDERVLRDERPIAERHVLQCNACDGH